MHDGFQRKNPAKRPGPPNSLNDSKAQGTKEIEKWDFKVKNFYFKTFVPGMVVHLGG
jgi:hypothetical protein